MCQNIRGVSDRKKNNVAHNFQGSAMQLYMVYVIWCLCNEKDMLMWMMVAEEVHMASTHLELITVSFWEN